MLRKYVHVVQNSSLNQRYTDLSLNSCQTPENTYDFIHSALKTVKQPNISMVTSCVL